MWLFFIVCRHRMPFMGQPDYRVYEMNRRLQQWTEVRQCYAVWFDMLIIGVHMQKIVLWHCGYFAWLYFEPSVLWCCWLGGRKGIRPVKKRVVWYWHGYLSGARCRLAYSPADATATHCLLLLQNPDWFTFLVPAHPRWPGKRAIKHVYICIFVGIVCKGLQFSHLFEVFCWYVAFSDLTFFVGQQEHVSCRKFTVELLMWLFVWRDVQMICMWSGTPADVTAMPSLLAISCLLY